jgi:hypothetical protein
MFHLLSKNITLKKKLNKIGISAAYPLIVIGSNLINVTVAELNGLSKNQGRRPGLTASRNISDLPKNYRTIGAFLFMQRLLKPVNQETGYR